MKRSADWSCFGTRTWLNIFSMSTETATALSRNGIKTPNCGCNKSGPFITTSFNDTPLNSADASIQISISRCSLLRGEVDTTFGQLVLVIRAR